MKSLGVGRAVHVLIPGFVNTVMKIAADAGITIDRVELQRIVDDLNSDSGSVRSSKPDEVDPSWFGGSSTGGHRLATNATMAHAEALDAFREMAEGLEQYGQVIEQFVEDIEGIDEQAADHNVALQQAADLVDEDFGQ